MAFIVSVFVQCVLSMPCQFFAGLQTFEQYGDTLRITPEKVYVSIHCLQLTVQVSMGIQTNATARSLVN